MAKTLWLVNLLLTALVAAMVYGMVQSFSEGQAALDPAARAPRGPQAAAPTGEADGMLTLLQKSRPPLAEFDLILAKETFKNPFAVIPRATVPPPPPLPPLPSLVGTMFVGEERTAVLTTTGEKTALFRIGQAVAGGRIVGIEADRVLIERNGNRETVVLKAVLQSAPPRPQAGVPQAAPPPPPSAPAPEAKPDQEQPAAVEAPSPPPTSPEPVLPGGRTILRRSGR